MAIDTTKTYDIVTYNDVELELASEGEYNITSVLKADGTQILDIETVGSPTAGEYKPNSDMVWGKEFCENDVNTDNPDLDTYKVFQYFSNLYTSSELTIPIGGAVKTGDGAYYDYATYGSSVKHVWGNSGERSTGNYDFKLRWIITYCDSEERTITLLNDVMYACFNRVKFGRIFRGKLSLEYFDIINGADWNNGVTSMYQVFQNCSSLRTIPLLNTSRVTNMWDMFNQCYSLEYIPLLDTSNVTSMQSMFSNCLSLQTIPLFNTSNVTTMSEMFNQCHSLKFIPLLNTSNVVSMYLMFSNCHSLQSIPLLDTRNVTNMNNMFSWCLTLQTIPLIDTRSLVTAGNMFLYCYVLKSISLSNTANITSILDMFNYCEQLQIISLQDLSNVTNAKQSFIKCDILEFLTVDNIGVSFDISSSTKFSQDTLVGILNGLKDLTGQTAQTLTMGTTNLAKLTEEQKAIATNKNWVLA